MRFFTYIALIASASAISVTSHENADQSPKLSREENLKLAKACKSVLQEPEGANVCPLPQDPKYKQYYDACVEKKTPITGPKPRDPVPDSECARSLGIKPPKKTGAT